MKIKKLLVVLGAVVISSSAALNLQAKDDTTYLTVINHTPYTVWLKDIHQEKTPNKWGTLRIDKGAGLDAGDTIELKGWSLGDNNDWNYKVHAKLHLGDTDKPKHNKYVSIQLSGGFVKQVGDEVFVDDEIVAVENIQIKQQVVPLNNKGLHGHDTNYHYILTITSNPTFIEDEEESKEL